MEAKASGADLPEYGSDGWVPIGKFGVEWRPGGGAELRAVPADQAGEFDLDLELTWGHQELVYEPYVRQLADTDPEVFSGDRVVMVIAWSDGSFQVTGHHRTAAARLRGDAAIRVRPIAVAVRPGDPAPKIPPGR